MKRNKEFQKLQQGADEEMSPKKRAKNNENDKPLRVNTRGFNLNKGVASCDLSPKSNKSNSMCETGSKKSAFAR